jgi:hypothetical protein
MKITNLKELKEFMNQMPDVEHPEWEHQTTSGEWDCSCQSLHYLAAVSGQVRWKPAPKLKPYMPQPPFLVKWTWVDLAPKHNVERFDFDGIKLIDGRYFKLDHLVDAGALHNAEGRDIWKPFTREVEG